MHLLQPCFLREKCAWRRLGSLWLLARSRSSLVPHTAEFGGVQVTSHASFAPMSFLTRWRSGLEVKRGQNGPRRATHN